MRAANDNYRRRQEYVYFILSRKQDAVKIGYSSGPSRLASLQTGNPDPLCPLISIPAGRDVERAVQEELDRFRISREWFRDDSLFTIYMLEHLAEVGHYAEGEERQVTIDEALDAVREGIREYDEWVAAGRLSGEAA